MRGIDAGVEDGDDGRARGIDRSVRLVPADLAAATTGWRTRSRLARPRCCGRGRRRRGARAGRRRGSGRRPLRSGQGADRAHARLSRGRLDGTDHVQDGDLLALVTPVANVTMNGSVAAAGVAEGVGSGVGSRRGGRVRARLGRRVGRRRWVGLDGRVRGRLGRGLRCRLGGRVRRRLALGLSLGAGGGVRPAIVWIRRDHREGRSEQGSPRAGRSCICVTRRRNRLQSDGSKTSNIDVTTRNRRELGRLIQTRSVGARSDDGDGRSDGNDRLVGHATDDKYDSHTGPADDTVR